jgi:hypothetical protein
MPLRNPGVPPNALTHELTIKRLNIDYLSVIQVEIPYP